MASNIKKTYSELYKELENINIKAVLSQESTNDIRISESIQDNGDTTFKSQSRAFIDAMRIPIISGQCAGLIPVSGVMEEVDTKVRFTIRSWRFVYSCTMCLIQMAAATFCLYRILYSTVTVRKLGGLAFYLTTSLTNIVFLQLAMNWQRVLRDVAAADLDDYIDPNIKFKCVCATLALLGSTIVEHLLLIIARVSVVLDCFKTDAGVLATVTEKMFFWTFDTAITPSLPIGLLYLIVNIISTLNWSYSHVFIVCISLYLTSILDQINTKINCREVSSRTLWRKLREDYNRTTKLINKVDSVINSIIFFSFASNLFFVCLQFYNVLSNVMRTYSDVTECPYYPSGPFYGYELLTYYVYSFVFIITRFLAVALIASRVHTSSKATAPLLNNVPSTEYCVEVERFQRQVQGSVTALSGLNFFYVTKELILSVAGTVVTYELVLLQLGDKQVT